MPPIVIGDITWLVQPGYPEYSEETGKSSIIAKFTARRELIAEKLPARGSTFYDDRWPWLNGMTSLMLTKRTIKPHSADEICDITLEYTSPELDSTDAANGLMETIELDDREMSIPIEQHENYFACWNYRLIAKGTITEPSWWETEKTTYISNEDAKKYKWLKVGDQVPDGWSEIKPAKKPGVESFIFPLCEVVWTRKAQLKKDLQSLANLARGGINAPKDTFGVSGEWLVVSCTLRKNGKYWTLTVRFRNSKKWDPEIY